MLQDKKDFSMNVDVGQKARIHFAQGRLWGTVLGWKPSQVILVDITEEDDAAECPQRGADCKIQYLKEGVIHRFETKVLGMVDLSSTMKLLALQFPDSVKTKCLRKFPRIRVQISATVVDEDNQTWQCMIQDISPGGCKVKIRGATFSIGDELTLFSFLPHQGPLVDVRCKVKNYYDEDSYGLEFRHVNPVQQNALDEFHKLLGSLGPSKGEGENQEVLSANLDYISLPELLQILTRSGRDYQVDIVNGMEFGRMFLKDGEIFSAEASDIRGEDAIFELFSLSDAHCYVQKTKEAPKRNVNAKLDQLILEFVHRLDEKAKLDFDRQMKSEKSYSAMAF